MDGICGALPPVERLEFYITPLLKIVLMESGKVECEKYQYCVIYICFVDICKSKQCNK